MGRHSRGAADGTPPPPPEPPARHPYATRSLEDTGAWDRSTYRVVDVGLPPDAPVAFPLGGSRAGNQPPGPSADLSRASLRSVPENGDTGARPQAEPHRYGATRAELAAMTELRYGATREPGAPRYGGTRAADVTESRYGATRADLAESRNGGTLEAPRPGADRAHGAAETSRYVAPETEAPDASRYGAAETSRYAAQDQPRYGATRADLAESVGATALATRPTPAPRPAAEPDEVTDTGARRARSAFRLAPDTDHPEPDQQDDEPDEHDYDEPSLLLQWGIFVAQTLTGAVAGLGVWLAFYRLWSTYPFYAAPAAGVATIVMLVLARTLRRRHGHDLDLMTAIVTVGVATVLAVLPATFALQSVS